MARMREGRMKAKPKLTNEKLLIKDNNATEYAWEKIFLHNMPIPRRSNTCGLLASTGQ